MDLECNDTSTFANGIIEQVGHRFTIEPGLNMVSFHANDQVIPFAGTSEYFHGYRESH